MNTVCRTGLGIAIVIGTAALMSAQPPPAAPMVREGATVKLAAHTWAIPDGNVGGVPNVGIIVGTRAALVIDTGLGSRNGEIVKRELNKIGRVAETYVAFTHYHPEHSLGAAAFSGARIVMPRIQQEEMRDQGKAIQNTFASRSPAWAELLAGAEYPQPDIQFDREQRLDLGGVQVRMFLTATPLHTRGDTAFWVEEDRVLFSGDLVMSRRFLAAQPNASIVQWLRTLADFAALKPLHVVPAHGDLGDAALIDRDRQYLETLQTRVGELKKQGRTVDDVAKAVAAEIAPRYPEWGNPAGSAATARAAFAEAP